MDRRVLLTSIQRLELRREKLVGELEVVELDLKAQQAQYSRLVNEDAIVYRLPNELLTGIFILCSRGGCTRRNSAPSLPFQVIASHVSHRWREVALGTPLLWNTINFDVRAWNHLQGRALSHLKAHLERSGSCFLDISLSFQIIDDLAVYCKLLAKYSRRWRRLSILTKFEEVDDIRDMLREPEVPILEHLSLNLSRSDMDSLSPRQKFFSVTPSILASCSPCLSFVRLAGQALGNLHPPTSSVTTLHLDGWTRHYMTQEQFRIVLEGAPSLVNLSLNQLFLHHPRDPLEIAKSTTLPFLRSLRLRGPCSPVSHLMSMMDTPQLESISLDGLETFGSQVLQTVQSLILDNCSFNEQEIGKLILSLPSLAEISIDELLPDIFYMLLPEATDMPNVPNAETTEGVYKRMVPWPQLHTLSVRNLQAVDVPYFCNMVVNRQLAGFNGESRPLRNLHLDRRSRTVLRTKQRLAWLQEKVFVGSADTVPPWPRGLNYEDAHDLLE